MNRTGIEWCDYTWNPILGCSPVSEGCANCYAKTMANRLTHNPTIPADVRAAYARSVCEGRWADPPQLSLVAERLEAPAKVKKPARVFVGSMTDLGHEGVDRYWIVQIVQAILAAPWHTYILLTKRPGLWVGTFPSACWVGVTAENQARADERIPLLLEIPAAVRFVSVEPMLEPVSLQYAAFNGADSLQRMAGIDWVIAGPETGPGARDCRDWWIDHLAIECGQAGVPFFDKRKPEVDGYARREWPE